MGIWKPLHNKGWELYTKSAFAFLENLTGKGNWFMSQKQSHSVKPRQTTAYALSSRSCKDVAQKGHGSLQTVFLYDHPRRPTIRTSNLFGWSWSRQSHQCGLHCRYLQTWANLCSLNFTIADFKSRNSSKREGISVGQGEIVIHAIAVRFRNRTKPRDGCPKPYQSLKTSWNGQRFSTLGAFDRSSAGKCRFDMQSWNNSRSMVWNTSVASCRIRSPQIYLLSQLGQTVSIVMRSVSLCRSNTHSRARKAERTVSATWRWPVRSATKRKAGQRREGLLLAKQPDKYKALICEKPRPHERCGKAVNSTRLALLEKLKPSGLPSK